MEQSAPERRRDFMPITLLDGLLLGMTLFSAVLAMVRGFSREVLSIVILGRCSRRRLYPLLQAGAP
jgi:membrane protein required for colicin V production